MKPGMRTRWITGRLTACGLAVLGLLALSTPPSQAQAQTGAHPQAALFSPPAERAIALAPHITELIFAAGAGDNIVATVTSSNYPAAALAIPRIGDGLNINVEKALTMRPDLVVAWQASGGALTIAPMLSRLNIPLIYSAPRTLQDIPAEIVRFGKIFNTENIADPTAHALEKRLQALSQQYSHKKPVTVFIEVGTAPLYTIGNDPLLNDALRLCGGVNIYANTAVAAPQVSTESVLVAQPQVVITSAIAPGRLEEATKRWAGLHLTAALQGHVYGIDPDQLYRPGPRMVEATATLCRYLDGVR